MINRLASFIGSGRDRAGVAGQRGRPNHGIDGRRFSNSKPTSRRIVRRSWRRTCRSPRAKRASSGASTRSIAARSRGSVTAWLAIERDKALRVRTLVAKGLAFFLLISVVCGALPHGALAQSVDPLEGRIVTEVRVTGLRHLSADTVERHLATKAGEPFRRATVASDRRRLDELRLFTAVEIERTPRERRRGRRRGGDRDTATAARGHPPRDGRERRQRRPGRARHQPPGARNTIERVRPFRRRDGCDRDP